MLRAAQFHEFVEQLMFRNGGLLPGPDAILAGPTFEEWLEDSGSS